MSFLICEINFLHIYFNFALHLLPWAKQSVVTYYYILWQNLFLYIIAKTHVVA